MRPSVRLGIGNYQVNLVPKYQYERTYQHLMKEREGGEEENKDIHVHVHVIELITLERFMPVQQKFLYFKMHKSTCTYTYTCTCTA